MFNGAKLKQLREKNGISKMELSRELGISDVMLYYIESGLRDPTTKVLYRAAKYFEVPIDSLFSDLKSEAI